MKRQYASTIVIWSRVVLRSAISISLLGLTAGIGNAQPTSNPSSTTVKPETPLPGNGATTPSALVALDEDYRIGINDVIEIQIEDAPELSGAFRIAKSGSFMMPFLGRTMALNKTPEELSRVLTDGLRDRYLSNPNVRVVVRQYNSRSFFIQGAVRSPGVYQVEGKPSLLVLLTLAGGLQPDHSSTAFILRPNKQEQAPSQATQENKPAGASPEKETGKELAKENANTSPNAQAPAGQNEYSLLRVNISGLLIGRFEQNTYLEPGDIVNIPQTEVFFVAGEVAAPGSFPLKEGTTLRQAISLAQGPNFKADQKRGVIFRDDPATGKKKEVKVDIAAVMKGVNEDVPILANDIIVIPNSKMKSIATPLLQALGVQAVRIPVY